MTFITFNNVTRNLSLFLKQARLDTDWFTIIFGVYLEIIVKVQIRIGGHMRNRGCCGTVLFYFPHIKFVQNHGRHKAKQEQVKLFFKYIFNIFCICIRNQKCG